MVRMKRLTKRLYLIDNEHWVLAADRLYKWCRKSKMPTDEFLPVEEAVEFQSLPTTRKSKLNSALSEDQIKKPVAPGFVDDAYTALTSGGG